MPIWKSRAGKNPPKEWLADVVEYLQRAHGVAPTKELIEALYPILVEQWQEGATYREAGKSTCACQKGTIVPSPGVQVRLGKGEVKPPRGAQRGDVFGAEDLRRKGEPPPPKVRTPRRGTKNKGSEPTAAPSALPPPPAPAASPPPPAPAAPPPAPAAPAPSPAADPAQTAAMMSAIQSMLPNVAAQIVAQVKGEKK